jgi:regulator of chromosome condensation
MRQMFHQMNSVQCLQVACGGLHTLVLGVRGEVWTFGCNDDKALGRETAEEEDAFTPGLVDLPKKAVQVSAGDSHSAALTEDGNVFGWGTFKVRWGYPYLEIFL